MSANKKPRKAYRPRAVTADTMALALSLAAKPAAADRAEVLDILRSAIKALREGVATEQQWAIAAGAVTVALAIERQGVVRGLLEHLQAAGRALEGIHSRAMHQGCGQWVRATLYYQELDALATFLDLHAFQLDHLGRAEFLAAIDKAQQRVITQGDNATVVRDLERLAA
jgi:hypothetical protein